MYVNLTARSLGSAVHLVPPPVRKVRLVPPPVQKHYTLPPVYKGLGTTAACADAGTGLLIDCWRAAEHKGLGYSLDQAQLAKVATAYQRMKRPNSLAGWVFTGEKMVWRGMGDAILPDPMSPDAWYGSDQGGSGSDGGSGWVVPPAYVTPPDPLTIAVNKTPLPPIVYQSSPVLPSVTAQTLFAAAQLPNAPAVVKQAAAQLPASAASVGGLNMGWFTQQSISGIPNYLLVGAGVVLLILVAKKRR